MIKFGEFLDQLRSQELPKFDPAPWSYTNTISLLYWEIRPVINSKTVSSAGRILLSALEYNTSRFVTVQCTYTESNSIKLIQNSFLVK
jgi:hypothetical protein